MIEKVERVAKFNPHHKPKGPGGGQFTSATAAATPSYATVFNYKGAGSNDPTSEVECRRFAAKYLGGAEAIHDYVRDLARHLDPDGKDVVTAVVDTYPDSSLLVTVWNGRARVKRQFHMDTEAGDVQVHHDTFKVDRREHGTGLATRMTSTMLDHYEKMGVAGISVEANVDVGGYAWARMGFVPSEAAWENVVRRIDVAMNDEWAIARWKTPAIHKAIYELLYEFRDPTDPMKGVVRSSPRNISKLAALRTTDTDGTVHNIGKDLLPGRNWEGRLNREDFGRFRAYMAEKAVAKFNANHRPAGTRQGGQFAPAAGAGDKPPEIHHHGHDFPDVEELGKEMFGSTQAVKEYAAAVAKHLKGAVVVRYETMGARSPKLLVTIQDDQQVHIERAFMLHPNGRAYVVHENFDVPKELQGQGLGLAIARTNFEQYARMGISHIETFANVDVGSYAWARMGFVPATSHVWTRLGHSLVLKTADLHLSPEQVTKVKTLVAGPPSNIGKIAALRLPGGRNLGKELLMHEHWEGMLDLHDPAAMRRVRSYLKKK